MAVTLLNYRTKETRTYRIECLEDVSTLLDDVRHDTGDELWSIYYVNSYAGEVR